MKVVFISIIFFCIIGINVQYFAINLPWDKSKTDFNPIENIDSMFLIQKKTYQIVGFYQDIYAMLRYRTLSLQTDFYLAYSIPLG